MKKKLIYATVALALVYFLLLITGNGYIYKALYYNFADIDDYQIFESRTIKASTNPQPWLFAQKYNERELSPALQKELDSLKTVSFLVIKNDSLIYEAYSDDYSFDSKSNSFSMAKSYVSALIGVALTEGLIKSIDDPVADYVDSFKEGSKSFISIKDVLMMSSGLSWSEGYSSPFSITTKAYYGDDINSLIHGLSAEEASGVEWSYKSGDTQVLALILKSITGKSLSEYMHEKLWGPMGYEQDAIWSLDHKDGVEKAYCCINTGARDFARLIKLYMNKGAWNGKQLIDSSYVNASLIPHDLMYKNQKCNFYGYQWWLIPDYKGCQIFYARGILGQFAIAIPEKNVIIVRLGHERGEKKEATMHHILTYHMIDEVLTWFP